MVYVNNNIIYIYGVYVAIEIDMKMVTSAFTPQNTMANTYAECSII